MTEATVATEPSLLEVLTPLVRRWKVCLGIPLVFGTLAAGVSFLIPETYAATTTFIPDNSGTTPSSALGGLASLASQFGIPGLGSSRNTPEFFAAVLKSRELLRSTLLARFGDSARSIPDSAGALLIDLLRITGKSEEERINNGIRLLERRVTTHVDQRTNVVTLSFEGRPPVLAAQVANRMVTLLNRFNLDTRRSQSHEQRLFVGERLAAAEQELRTAEDSQLRFLKENRRYQDSPLLTYEANRLEREVQFRQEIFTALGREFEEARIAEVRDTPVLTIIDGAVPPDRKSHPRRRLLVALGVLLGAVSTIGFIYLSESWKDAEHVGRPDYKAFQSAWDGARKELRGLVAQRHSKK